MKYKNILDKYNNKNTQTTPFVFIKVYSPITASPLPGNLVAEPYCGHVHVREREHVCVWNITH